MSDLIVSCLDSRSSRQRVNEIAWRLNTPLADCGVLGSQKLARVDVYVPSPEGNCVECNWSHEDYSQIEQQYLCGAGSGAAFPTMASSALGALAASLMSIEIAKILDGERGEPVAARQVIVGAEHHFAQLSTSRRNPNCRFDHRSWFDRAVGLPAGDDDGGRGYRRARQLAGGGPSLGRGAGLPGLRPREKSAASRIGLWRAARLAIAAWCRPALARWSAWIAGLPANSPALLWRRSGCAPETSSSGGSIIGFITACCNWRRHERESLQRNGSHLSAFHGIASSQKAWRLRIERHPAPACASHGPAALCCGVPVQGACPECEGEIRRGQQVSRWASGFRQTTCAAPIVRDVASLHAPRLAPQCQRAISR